MRNERRVSLVVKPPQLPLHASTRLSPLRREKIHGEREGCQKRAHSQENCVAVPTSFVSRLTFEPAVSSTQPNAPPSLPFIRRVNERSCCTIAINAILSCGNKRTHSSCQSSSENSSDLKSPRRVIWIRRSKTSDRFDDDFPESCRRYETRWTERVLGVE